MAERKIGFEKVKKIVSENIACGCLTHEAGWNGTGTLLAVKICLDGLHGAGVIRRPDSRAALLKVRDEAIKYVKSSDVRCANDIIALVPKGLDNRLQNWMYDGVTAELDDEEGWVLYPKAS